MSCKISCYISLYDDEILCIIVSSSALSDIFMHMVEWFWNQPHINVHGANMGPTWVMLASDGPHVGPLNLAIRAHTDSLLKDCNNNPIANALHSSHPCTELLILYHIKQYLTNICLAVTNIPRCKCHWQTQAGGLWQRFVLICNISLPFLEYEDYWHWQKRLVALVGIKAKWNMLQTKS